MKQLRIVGLALAMALLALTTVPAFAHGGHGGHGNHGGSGGGAGQGTGAPGASARFTIVLTGAAEVGTPGDPDGAGVARVVIREGRGEICIASRTSGLSTVTLAHIHRGAAGTNGPVVVDFTNLIDGERVVGCVGVDADLIARISGNPANYYVNIHTDEFPRGALRGQLE